MIESKGADTVIGAYGISDRVPHRMDTEISPPYPESWRERLPPASFFEGSERYAGMRDGGVFHPGRPYPHGNGDSSEIFGK